MTNYMRKITLAVTGALLLVTPALAAPSEDINPPAKVCEQPWKEVYEKLKSSEDTMIIQLGKEQIETMVEKAGPPPRTQGEFDAYFVTQGSLSAVFITQDGCTTDRLGPVPTMILKKVLGLNDA